MIRKRLWHLLHFRRSINYSSTLSILQHPTRCHSTGVMPLDTLKSFKNIFEHVHITDVIGNLALPILATLDCGFARIPVYRI